MTGKHTPGPWQYVPSSEHHGPFVTSEHGSTICDCYTMSQPSLPSTRNGGSSAPITFMGEMADPNARLIAAAPLMLSELRQAATELEEAANIIKAAGALPMVAQLFSAAADKKRSLISELER